MTFKEQRNEAIARGVGVVRRRYVCAYVVGLRGAGSGFQWEKQPQTDRWGSNPGSWRCVRVDRPRSRVAHLSPENLPMGFTDKGA